MPEPDGHAELTTTWYIARGYKRDDGHVRFWIRVFLCEKRVTWRVGYGVLFPQTRMERDAHFTGTHRPGNCVGSTLDCTAFAVGVFGTTSLPAEPVHADLSSVMWTTPASRSLSTSKARCSKPPRTAKCLSMAAVAESQSVGPISSSDHCRTARISPRSASRSSAPSKVSSYRARLAHGVRSSISSRQAGGITPLLSSSVVR